MSRNCLQQRQPIQQVMNTPRLYSVLLLAVCTGNASCCRKGWLSHDATCYQLSRDRETWIGALQMCREMGAELVEIESDKENAFLKSEARSRHYNFWIALNDVNEDTTWTWMNTKETIGVSSFTDWYPGQPSNRTDGSCVALYIDIGHSGWRWYNLSCSETHHYVCEQSET